jgi:hypothetical protein
LVGSQYGKFPAFFGDVVVLYLRSGIAHGFYLDYSRIWFSSLSIAQAFDFESSKGIWEVAGE